MHISELQDLTRADTTLQATCKVKTSPIRGCSGIAGPGTGLQASQAMSVISGTEATYLLEARLDRTYTGELRPSIQLIDSWHSTGATQQRGGVTEELRRASRRVEGYWKRYDAANAPFYHQAYTKSAQICHQIVSMALPRKAQSIRSLADCASRFRCDGSTPSGSLTGCFYWHPIITMIVPGNTVCCWTSCYMS